MPKSETSLSELLYEIRRIEQNREILSEKKIRAIYRTLMKDLNAFLADGYVKYSDEDGRFYLSYLDAQNKRAKFLEEIVEHVDSISPDLRKEMLSLIDDTYQKSYEGMVEAFKKANTPEKFKSVTEAINVNPDMLKQGIENNISKLTLPTVMEKNRQEIIYQIQQTLNIGLMNGDRYETLAKKISERVDVSYNKAINIARTETHRVQESGLLDSAKDIAGTLDGSGLVYTATWRTMKDSRVRPNQRRRLKKGWKTYSYGKADHTKMEGVTIKIGDRFKLEPNVYAECPGMSGVARHDCRCRCYLDYDLMTEEEFNAFENKQVNNFDRQTTEKPVEEHSESDIIKSERHKELSTAEELKNASKSDIIKKNEWDNGLKPRGQLPHIEKENIYSFVANELGISEEKSIDYVDSVTSFTDMLFTEIRRYQRGETVSTDVRKISESIEEYIKAAPRWNGGTTYRGCLVSDAELSLYKPGYIINSMGGTSSWSNIKEIAIGFAKSKPMYERPNPVLFHCDTQSKGTGIKHLSIFEEESEVLCSKESKYIVQRVEVDDENITHVYLKESE